MNLKAKLMSIDTMRQFLREKAEEFGGILGSDFIERNNTKEDAFTKGGAYFGIISPQEEPSGPYHDFSIVVFPSQNEDDIWLIALGVGSLGFKNDYDLASFPGVRRLFSKVINTGGFIKSDFTDIETGLPKTVYTLPEIAHLRKAIDNNSGYGKVLPAIQILTDPTSEESKKCISAFTAIYAKVRGWDTTNRFKKAISQALIPFLQEEQVDDLVEVQKLLRTRKFMCCDTPA
jgi:hypothetical protein